MNKYYISLSLVLVAAATLQLNGMKYDEYKAGIVDQIESTLGINPIHPANVIILTDFLEENPERKEEIAQFVIGKADAIVAQAEQVANKTKPTLRELNTAVTGLLLLDFASRVEPKKFEKLPAAKRYGALLLPYFLSQDSLVRKYKLQFVADEKTRDMIRKAKHPLEA